MQIFLVQEISLYILNNFSYVLNRFHYAFKHKAYCVMYAVLLCTAVVNMRIIKNYTMYFYITEMYLTIPDILYKPQLYQTKVLSIYCIRDKFDYKSKLHSLYLKVSMVHWALLHRVYCIISIINTSCTGQCTLQHQKSSKLFFSCNQ